MPIFQRLTGLKRGFKTFLYILKTFSYAGPPARQGTLSGIVKERKTDDIPKTQLRLRLEWTTAMCAGCCWEVRWRVLARRGHARHPCRCPPSGHLTSSMQAPAAHTNAPLTACTRGTD